ncbi:hypothetical protein GCM10009111_29560 [Colwellia asteriadis]|uniref:Carbohydrate-binding family V/XII n=1 Tax=Colwellia asteriadis TaxID=517723 RepID=A0ABN1LAD5_9GAMM
MQNMIKRNTRGHWLKFVYLKFITFMLIGASSYSFAIDWPQELSGELGTIIVYQPQPEKLNGNILTGRAAMSLELPGKPEPIFGVFWFSSTISTDRSNDSAVISGISVTKVGWPDSKDAQEEKFTKFVEAELVSSSFTTSLSKLTASLTTAEKVSNSLAEIKNDPPNILFKEQLAVLLSFDGEAIFKDIEKSTYQRALNTPFAVVKVKNKEVYYLTSGSLWYQSTKVLGPWHITHTPPADLVAMMPKDDNEEDSTPVTKVPEVVTVTKPTELVVSDGKPQWTSLLGGKLLYVNNTETPWLRELSSGDMYLLLSGRWFKSKAIKGPWAFVRPDKLPKSFKDIPPDSDIGGLRTSVAGTDEAEQAVLDAQIPQTATIKRSEAKLTVEYDGKPKFVAIKGTDVEYAVNTNAQVLKINGKYYAVDNGVWFVSEQAQGSWQVADNIPESEIAQIPASSPVYNTTYVKVYSSTPEVVYVGYTPGYLWSYPYYGVPIYGTGWYYPPYYAGGWYYPRPPTWGLHVGYNPWTGWNVGVSWGGPFFRVGVSWGGGYHNHYRPCCGGFYGGYRGGHNTNINVNGNINIGNSVSIGNKNHIQRNIGNHVSNNKFTNSRVGTRHNNLYNRVENKQRNATKLKAKKNYQQGRVTTKRANNVFADKRGNVVRHENGQWQNRSNKSWSTIENKRPNTQINNQNIRKRNNGSFDRGSMNRDLRGRQMGNMQRGGQGRMQQMRRGR